MEKTVYERLDKSADYAIRSMSRSLVYQTYGECLMASELGAISAEEFTALNHKLVYEPETDYDGRWSAESIREALADGVLTGYPDGLFRPDRAVTREELAQFWHNIKEALRK